MPSTDTAADTKALQEMLAHHATLADGVERRVAALRVAADQAGYAAPAGELVAYLAQEVLPHATAEEQTLYRVAAEREGLAETVAGMVDEHHRLTALAEQLATAGERAAATRTAEEIGSLFAGHVAKENERILPPLAADPEVDLPDLLVRMHRLTETAKDESPVAEEAVTSDPEDALVRLLLGAARELAGAGRGDAACRLAAQTWVVVRRTRPELAVRVTAALHGLVRWATSEPVALSTGRRASGENEAPVLDVRTLAPAQRHEKIFATYGALGPGTGFVLVNDHDPKPLRYQFEAEHRGAFTWDVLEAGPTVWRVRIGRPAGDAGDEESTDGPARLAPSEPELDVRRFPHGQRHDVIFTTFDALAEGTGFVLVNDHDPKPLRYQFEAQHAGRYSWDYLEAGPTVWRVRIGRPAGGLR